MSGKFVGPVDLDVPVKFRDHRLNRSREIPPKAVGGSIFNGFFLDNFRLEVVSDVISSVAVAWSVWMSVPNLVSLGRTVLEIFEPISL